MSFLVRRGIKKNLGLMIVLIGLLYVLATLTGSHHRHSLSRKRLEHLQEIRRNLDEHGAPRKFKWAPHQPNLVESHPERDLVYNDCVPLPDAPIRRAKICIYPRKFDRRSSEFLKQGRNTDKDLIQQMTRALRLDHRMQLVDLGANLGEYTLHAASWGSRVLAVEMYPDNIRQLQTSLAVSGLSNYVTLVHNAFYSDHRQMTAQYIRVYLGDRYIHIPKPNCQHWGITEENIAADQVNSICMDDLLPLLDDKRVFLRLNLDGLEPVALQCAFKFFEKADVQVVQMRWIDKTQEEMDVLNEFMKLEWGFKASREALQYVPANTNVPTTFKGYVYWIKVNKGEEEEEEEEEDEKPVKKAKKGKPAMRVVGEHSRNTAKHRRGGKEREEEDEERMERKGMKGKHSNSRKRQVRDEEEEEKERQLLKRRKERIERERLQREEEEKEKKMERRNSKVRKPRLRKRQPGDENRPGVNELKFEERQKQRRNGGGKESKYEQV